MSKLTLLILALTVARGASDAVRIKISSRPVHEAHNEHARTDSRVRTAKAPQLPYGNPFAGNSQRTYRLYAQNQQAMFNAEKVRQHRAQLQRWSQVPQQMDTYMKAYHESQESHQLALENQQARDVRPERIPKRESLRSEQRVPKRVVFDSEDHHQMALENTQVNNKPERMPKREEMIPKTEERLPKREERLPIREERLPIREERLPIREERLPIREERLPRRENFQRPARLPKRLVFSAEPTKITIADAIKDGNRNHRSHGSDHNHFMALKRYQTIYVSPAPTYDQGVTIKPHGIIGLSRNPESQTKLLTKAIPSTEAPIYPRPYASQSFDKLNSFLKQPAHDQLSSLNALIEASKGSETKDNDIETPVELFFYQKDAPVQTLSSHYESNPTLSYASAYTKEHAPVMEDIDDINPVEEKVIYTPQPPVDPRPNFYHGETTTTKSNNYYKVEVASQTIKSGVKPQGYYKPEHTEVRAPSFQEPSYQPVYYHRSPTAQTELENYAHRGLQHLTPEGTEVSHYDDESENLHYASNYEFGYRVHDYEAGNDFGHQEAKIGDNTSGQYHVLLPDGRMQRVKYSAGPEGFHADVSYDHLHLQHEK